VVSVPFTINPFVFTIQLSFTLIRDSNKLVKTMAVSCIQPPLSRREAREGKHPKPRAGKGDVKEKFQRTWFLNTRRNAWNRPILT
jgi:hypothetical protein